MRIFKLIKFLFFIAFSILEFALGLLVTIVKALKQFFEK